MGGPRVPIPGRRTVIIWTWRVGIIGAMLAVWEWSVAAGLANETFSGRPSAIAREFTDLIVSGGMWFDAWVTLYETFTGFVIAAAIGIAFGILTAEMPMVETVLKPILTAFNSLPRIALAPLFVLWFGLGSLSRIVLVASLVFFIVAFNTAAALVSAERDFLLLARSLGAGRIATFWRYRLPAAVPTIFAGLQLALTYAFLGAVTGEMLTGTHGLGARLALAIALYDTSQFFAFLLALVVISVAISTAVAGIEARLLRWRAAEIRGLASAGR